jgi:hypothetical protein
MESCIVGESSSRTEDLARRLVKLGGISGPWRGPVVGGLFCLSVLLGSSAAIERDIPLTTGNTANTEVGSTCHAPVRAGRRMERSWTT